ncbi:hypothetical protein DFQ28_007445 [Apophysomyces sp. BC1034]|nr:hypothetical protein DFQ29_004430 [Apophysomyces sp. BC1021]KAG0192835.1 hypothetical protein DFQ28_007445 [Apophysomyces sp. BC1034]
MNASQSNDFKLSSPPTDGVSGLAFSPQADFLAVSSWDNQIRIYEVEPTGNTVPKASYGHEGPVLCVTWSKDGTKVISGGADKAGRMYDVATGQSTQIAEHAEPIKCAKFLDQGQQILATGSWDKTIKYWDLRSPTPVGVAQLPERCFSMDTASNLLVAATADRHVVLFDLNSPTTIFKWQTRAISAFIDGKGYAVGSIEGRVGIQYIDERDQAKSFSFKCHRDVSSNIYSVNAISFHPIYGTFATAGADGQMNFWDKDSKQRLKSFDMMNGPISATGFNRNGSIFAYAVSYDWTKSTNPAEVYLHATRDEDIKPKGTKGKR